MAVLCVTGVAGYWLLIFRERLDPWTAAGAILIVGAGIYTILRERMRAPRDVIPR